MQLVRNGDVADWRLQDAEFLSTFTLPRSRWEFLARRNPVARDARISFDEKEHVYHVDGIRVPRSVTGFLHAFTEEFNAYEAIVSMQHGYDWETKREKYLKEDGQIKTADEIANDWATNGAVQRARGQLLHFHAEQFLNGCEIEEPHSPEFKQFLQIYDVIYSKGWQIFRTEFSLFHCGLRIAGQADLLCRDPQGKFIIIDWKRSREIRFNGFRPMKPPLEHLPDCNYYLYCLQLNLYAYILESEYGFTVTHMVLGVVHPQRNNAQIIEVPRMSAEIRVLVEHEIAGGRASEPSELAAPFVLTRR